METIFGYMEKYDYENLFLCQDRALGFKAVIAIHDTTLGPATGGCRMWPYPTEMEAIEDALRLARGMTYKYAAAGCNLGGGKTVIIGDPYGKEREPIFRTLGKFINRLGGKYITGEDVGTTLRDMEYIRMETPYVVTLPTYLGGAGDIAPMTAFGTLQAMRACSKEVFGTDDLRGRTVSVQGLGAVGYHVVRQLVEQGAKITVTDIHTERLNRVVKEFGVPAVSPEEIYNLNVEIYSPCALGATLNDETLKKMKCQIICGCANNQLKEERHGDSLHKRGILYAPDYIANAGGTIYDTDRVGVGNVNHERAKEKVSRIYQTMERVIEISKEQKVPTYVAADRLAEERIRKIAEVKKYGGDLPPIL